MSVDDIKDVVLYLVTYCTPAAFVVNLVAYGVRVIIDAVTGRGIKL